MRNDASSLLARFQKALKKEFGELTDDKLWEAYARAGFMKGAQRSYEDVRAKQRLARRQEPASVIGAREEFLKTSFGGPVAVDKIKVLAQRSFSDMQGVTDAISARMTRTLADGLVEGKNPRSIASQLAEDMDVALSRATTIARTEIVRAHAEGQLEALDKLGVEEVGVQVEWLTAGDDRVCEACASLEGATFSLEEARGMLPRHPNCRCAWIPSVPTGNSVERFVRLLNVMRCC